MNEWNGLGFVGKQPEIRTTQDGREVATFAFATSESWKDKTTGEKKEITDWHKIVIFQKHLVDLTKNYITKGSKLLLRGKIKTRSYDDKKSGEKRYTTEIVLDSITLLDSKKSAEKPQANNAYQKDELPDNDFPDDNIPF